MPIYEYRCASCGHKVEVIQKLSDRPLKKCPECSGKLEKLVSRSSFALKGGGWFIHDYAGSKSKKDDAGDKTSSASKASPEATPSKKDSAPTTGGEKD